MLFNRYSVLLGILKSAGSITCKTFVQQKLGGDGRTHVQMHCCCCSISRNSCSTRHFATPGVVVPLQCSEGCSTCTHSVVALQRESCSIVVALGGIVVALLYHSRGMVVALLYHSGRDGCSTCRPDVNFRARAATSTNALSNVYYPSMIFSMIRHNGQIVSTRKSNQDETRDS